MLFLAIIKRGIRRIIRLKGLLLWRRRNTLEMIKEERLCEGIAILAEKILSGLVEMPASFHAIKEWFAVCLVEYAASRGRGRESLLGIMSSLFPKKLELDPVVSVERHGPLRILFVTGMFPSRTHAGGLRIFDLITELSARHTIDCISVGPTNSEESECPELLKYLDKHLFLKVDSFSWNQAEEWLINNGRGYGFYDVVHYEYLNTSEFLKHIKRFGKKNVFTMMESVSRRCFIDFCNTFDRWETGDFGIPLFFEFLMLGSYESTVCRDADLVVALSDEDAQFITRISGTRPVVVPTGVSRLLNYQEESSELTNTVLFLGNYDHFPNVEGLIWYLKNVHGSVIQEVPDYQIKIVGKGDLVRLRSQFLTLQGVSWVGEVDDISAAIVEAKACIAPLVSGAGFRGKVNQYSFFKKPTVATSIALSGLPYVQEESILQANNPRAFARHVASLLKDEGKRRVIGENAKRVVDDNFAWTNIVRTLEGYY